MSRDFITKYQELRVYQLAFEAAMSLRELEYELPEREKTLLAEPMLLAARLVFIHVAAAWHKRYLRSCTILKRGCKKTRDVKKRA